MNLQEIKDLIFELEQPEESGTWSCWEGSCRVCKKGYVCKAEHIECLKQHLKDHMHEKPNMQNLVTTANIKKCFIHWEIKKQYLKLENVYHFQNVKIGNREYTNREICCECWIKYVEK